MIPTRSRASGGNDFVVLAWRKRLETLDALTDRLQAEFEPTIAQGDEPIVGMSSGVAVHASSEEGDLLSPPERAATAMYRNKKFRRVECK